MGVEKIDISKETAIEGFSSFKLPYAQVDGESHFLVVAFGGNVEPFKKTMAISKTYIMYINWDNWLEIPMVPKK